jgi:glycerol transport system ATP-binding protein
VLLDEPLANLDYKLREELREELPRIFSATGAIFVYATTEPVEALLLAGSTATLARGRITQFGPTVEVYRKPNSLETARIFSDPPINTLTIQKTGGILASPGAQLKLPSTGLFASLPDGSYTIGFRPNHLFLMRPGPEAVAVTGTVAITEITGSESFIHVDFADQRWVALAHGVHDLDIGQPVELYLDPSRFFVFDASGGLAAAPGLSRAAA